MKGRRQVHGTAAVDAVLAQAERAVAQGQVQSLPSIAERLMTMAAAPATALHRLAQLAHRAGDIALTESLMRAATRAAPEQAALHASLGDLLHATGRAADASTAWREALRLDPRQSAVRFRLGTVLLESGAAAEAEGHFRELLRESPAEPAFLGALASSLLAQQRVADAIGAFQTLATHVPRHAGVQTELARLHRRQGEIDLAVSAAERVLHLSPDSPPARVLLAELLLEAGRAEQAERVCGEALERAPRDLALLLLSSSILMALHRPEPALRAARRAVEVHAGSAEAYSREALALFDLARIEEAAKACRQCLAIEPGHTGARYQLAAALLVTGETHTAVAELRQLLAEAPDHPGAWALMASARVDEGDLDEAQRCARRALQLDPTLADAWLTLARLGHIASDDAQAREQLTRIADDSGASDDGRAVAHLALGQLSEESADHDAAFRHYAAGNRLVARRLVFDTAGHVALVDALIETFGAAAITGIEQAAGSDSERPLFVLGMPRSGTTLVEQILASHPKVHGGGERMFFEHQTHALGGAQGHAAYPRRLMALSADALADLVSRYLALLGEDAGEALRVTDKLPANFLHLGLIAALFPRARIVHCTRDPLDTCLSIYLQRFSAGNHYAYDCQALAVYYRQYQRLMAHWERTLPGRIHALGYERLVAHQEAVSRELLAAVGLDWHDGCLDFHQTRRVVRTASRWQVRKPLYSTSVGRAQRFGANLAPLREALISAGVTGVEALGTDAV